MLRNVFSPGRQLISTTLFERGSYIIEMLFTLFWIDDLLPLKISIILTLLVEGVRVYCGGIVHGRVGRHGGAPNLACKALA